MYMQMMQRSQASNQFNNGLALMAASAYPGRNPNAIINAMHGMNQDPTEMFGNLVKLQQFGQEQQNLAAYRQGLPGIMSKYNLDPSLQPLLAANPDILTKIVEQRSGVGGDAVTQELNSARADWHSQNPGKSDSDMIAARPDLAGVLEFTGAKTEQGKTLATAAVDKLNAKDSFSKIDPTLAAQETNLEWLNDPAHRDAVIKAIQNPNLSSGMLGGAASEASGITGIDQDVLNARVKLDQVKKELYADRFAGTKNIRSNTEANNLGAAASLLDSRNNDADTIGSELGRLVHDVGAARGNLAASAGQVVPAKYADLVDKNAFLDPKSPLYNGATIEKASQGGQGGGGGGQGGQGGGAPAGGQKLSADDLEQAKALIARDGRDAVIAHLKAKGYDTSGL
jgi:hypothetical protein